MVSVRGLSLVPRPPARMIAFASDVMVGSGPLGPGMVDSSAFQIHDF